MSDGDPKQVKISDTAEVVRALRDLAMGIQNGKISAASFELSPTGICRLSTVYVTSRSTDDSLDLPGLPPRTEEETKPC